MSLANLTPGLYGFLNGETIFVLPIVNQSLEPPPGRPLPWQTTVDRLLLIYSAHDAQTNGPEPHAIVMDPIPEVGGSFGAITTISIAISGAPARVRVECQLRCRVLIAGASSHGDALLSFTLTDDETLTGQSSRVVGIIDPQLNHSALFAGFIPLTRLTRDQLDPGPAGYELSLLDSLLSSPLYDALGLARRASLGRTTGRFRETRRGSRIFTPALMRGIALLADPAVPQQIQLPDLTIQWSSLEIDLAGLDGDSPCAKIVGRAEQWLWVDDDEFVEPPARELTGHWLVNFAGFPSQGILDAWNDQVAQRWIRGLREVAGGLPISAIPLLCAWNGNTNAEEDHSTERERIGLGLRWEVGIWIRDQYANRHVLRATDFDHASGVTVPNKIAVSLAWLRPLAIRRDARPPDTNCTSDPTIVDSLHVLCEMPCIRSHNGANVRFNAVLQPVRVGDREPSGFAFQLTYRRIPEVPAAGGIEAIDAQPVRMGSLDLVFGRVVVPTFGPCVEASSGSDSLGRSDRPETLPRTAGVPLEQAIQDFESSQFRVLMRGAPITRKRPATRLVVSFDSFIGLSQIEPGNQDRLLEEQFVGAGGDAGANDRLPASERTLARRFRREQPLLIWNAADLLPEPASAPQQQVKLSEFVLNVREQTQEDRSQTLALRLLLPRAPDSALIRHLQRRLRLIVVDRQPLFTAWVKEALFDAELSGDLRELAIGANDAQLGISWLLRRDRPEFKLYLPPQGVGEASERYLHNKNAPLLDDVAPQEVADFRFTPGAVAELRASAFDRRFVEAPWNLRRLMGQTGSEAPGAEIVALNMELLYGMPVQLAKPGLRLAEQTTLQGFFPGELPGELPWMHYLERQRSAYQIVREAWSLLYERLLARLALLRPWLLAREEQLVVSAAEGGNDVRYRLRSAAHLRYPVVGEVGIPNSPAPREPDGLPGGVGWGFPDASSYDAIWLRPDSDAGVLADPYLSALGGWGRQKAVYRQGLTTIYSTTSMGRSSFYSVEMLGCIGCCRHRAKHVIIFERSVVPSEQYQDGKEQDLLLGRPVLRKVREFVEILTPVATFGNANASQRERWGRGPLLSVEFKTLTINVRENWKEQVCDAGGHVIGYKVRLWDPVEALSAASEVYPKPHVICELAGDPASGGSFKVDVLNPEKLVFFHRSVFRVDPAPSPANPDVIEPDTDRWEFVAGVDFPEMLAVAEKTSPFPSANNLDADLAPPAEIIAGLDGFTLQLANVGRTANLMSDRTAEVVGATLRNIVIARPAGQSWNKAIADLKNGWKSSDLARQIDEALATLKLIHNGGGAISVGEAMAAVRDLLDNALKPAQIDPLRIAASRANKSLESAESIAQAAIKDFIRDVQALRGADASIQQSLLARHLRLKLELGRARGQSEAILSEWARMRQLFQTAAQSLDAQSAFIMRLLIALPSRVAESLARAPQTSTDLRAAAERAAAATINAIVEQISAARMRLRPLLEAISESKLSLVEFKFAALHSAFDDPAAGLRKKLSAAIVAAAPRPEQIIAAVSNEVAQNLAGIENAAAACSAELRAWAARLDQSLRDVEAPLVSQLALFEDELLKKINAFTSLDAFVTQTQTLVNAQWPVISAELESTVDRAMRAIRKELSPWLQSQSARLESLLGAARGQFESYLDRLDAHSVGQLQAIAHELRLAIDAEKAGVADLVKNVNSRLNQAQEVVNASTDAADRALRVLRAFGESPAVANLAFNAPQLGYYFNQAEQAVKTTPVCALFDRFTATGERPPLRALGLRVPTKELLGRVAPEFDMSKFEQTPLAELAFNEVLPNFAGLDLSGLVPSLQLPENLRDNVHVRHGVDPQTQRAWVAVDVEFQLQQPAEVFTFGPVKLTLMAAKFESHTKIETALGGGTNKTVTGKITGDWVLNLGALEIVRLVTTELRFDQTGRMKFDIRPEKIRPSGALQFLGDMLKAFSGKSDSGFTFRLATYQGLPVGVEALLDLPLPNLVYGAFGVSNIRVGVGFEIVALPDFAIGVRFFLGRREYLFTITIFILGGSGSVEVSARYLPFQRQITTSVAIYIGVSAVLGITLGPINGMVGIYFVVKLAFFRTSGGDSSDTFAIGIMVMVVGRVDVLGIASASICLSLEGTYYPDSGQVIGRGTLSICIKICWCFTLEISQQVEMTFGGGGQAALAWAPNLGPALAPPEYFAGAGAHLGMFEFA